MVGLREGVKREGVGRMGLFPTTVGLWGRGMDKI